MTKPRAPDDVLAQIGLRLKATRAALDIQSQEELAAAIGTTRTALNNWENGLRMPAPLAMVRLWQRTGVTLEWIYAGDLRGMPWELASRLADGAREVGAALTPPPGAGFEEVQEPVHRVLHEDTAGPPLPPPRSA